MKKFKVYIAGPYTKGDVGINVRNAMDVCNKLINLGIIPFCPHLMHFQNISYPQSYETWLEYDIEWLKQCDIILRLNGESDGADYEVTVAEHRDMPVFYTIEELANYIFNYNNDWPLFDTNSRGQLERYSIKKQWKKPLDTITES